MTKKIRLIDEEATTADSTTTGGAAAFTAEDVERLMKYAEQIDWKLWELLKIARSMSDNS